jgi:2-dehydropantoate 2-reductase
VRIKASAISRDNVGRNAGGSGFVAIVAPGVICQTGTYQQMTFGALDGRARAASACAICALRPALGILSPDIRVPLWEKFIGLVPLSGLNALTRLPLGKWRDDPDLFALAYGRACSGSVPVCRLTTISAGRRARSRIPAGADRRPPTSQAFRRRSVGRSSR